jgi:hypothetical protein
MDSKSKSCAVAQTMLLETKISRRHTNGGNCNYKGNIYRLGSSQGRNPASLTHAPQANVPWINITSLLRNVRKSIAAWISAARSKNVAVSNSPVEPPEPRRSNRQTAIPKDDNTSARYWYTPKPRLPAADACAAMTTGWGPVTPGFVNVPLSNHRCSEKPSFLILGVHETSSHNERCPSCPPSNRILRGCPLLWTLARPVTALCQSCCYRKQEPPRMLERFEEVLLAR